MKTSVNRKLIRCLVIALLLILPLSENAFTVGTLNASSGPKAFSTDVARKDYAATVEMFERFIAHEMADKELPALSIALVDDQYIVWAKGFGFADPKAKVPATAETVYRVGSVSKLFTDIAIMQLVEQGKLDLDAPAGSGRSDVEP